MFVDELSATTNWPFALPDISEIAHCAARSHVIWARCADPRVMLRQVNVEGTLQLARQAVSSGVKRFVFVISVKENCEETELGPASWQMVLRQRKIRTEFLSERWRLAFCNWPQRLG